MQIVSHKEINTVYVNFITYLVSYPVLSDFISTYVDFKLNQSAHIH